MDFTEHPAGARACARLAFAACRNVDALAVPGDTCDVDLVRTAKGLFVPEGGRAGVILDRDGTLNLELGRSVHAPEELLLAPGAAEGICRLNEAGVAVLVATNQACVARGAIDEEMLGRIHQKLANLLEKEGARLDGIYYCPHHPTEGRGAYLTACDCRKPLPGLLNRASREWGLNPATTAFVGDRDTDVKAARAAGVRAIVVTNGWSHAPWQPPADPADETVRSLAEMAGAYLDRLMGKRE